MQPNNKPQQNKPPQSMPASKQQMQMQAPMQYPMQMQQQQIPYQSMQQVPMNNAYQQQMQYPMQQVAPQMQMQMPMQCNVMPPYGGFGHQAEGIVLIGKDDAEYMKKKTAAIIISIHNGSTYDGLFTTVQQKSQEGTKTLVYSASANAVDKLIEGFEGKSKDELVIEMFKEIKKIDHDCTVFNWECSSGYSGQTFTEGADKVMKLVGHVINNKHMAMFSDFSLKALIAQWNSHVLGPNPFMKMSNEFSTTVLLKFEPATLKESPSAQLQSVGDLSEGGKCNVHCLGGTIIYSVDPKKADHKSYKLQVLTVAENAPVDSPGLACHIKNAHGAAGHILLTYPNGGKLLTSMGHWVELVKVDTSEQKLFEMAQRQYGTGEVKNLQMQMASLNPDQKMAFLQNQAQAYVQTSAPCNNIAQKMTYGQYKS